MPLPWPVNELEIVGYANVLKANALPSFVAPVFLLKSDADRAFVPPYSLNAGFLCNSTEVPGAELHELQASGRITLFTCAFPAAADFALWIDQSFQSHYEALEEAQRKLRSIAEEAIRGADNAMRTGDFQKAESLASTAISADDRRVDPLVIKAAIRRKNGDLAGERLMARLATHTVEPGMFDRMVADYADVLVLSTRPATRARTSTTPRVRGMASERIVTEDSQPAVGSPASQPRGVGEASLQNISTLQTLSEPKALTFAA